MKKVSIISAKIILLFTFVAITAELNAQDTDTAKKIEDIKKINNVIGPNSDAEKRLKKQKDGSYTVDLEESEFNSDGELDAEMYEHGTQIDAGALSYIDYQKHNYYYRKNNVSAKLTSKTISFTGFDAKPLTCFFKVDPEWGYIPAEPGDPYAKYCKCGVTFKIRSGEKTQKSTFTSKPQTFVGVIAFANGKILKQNHATYIHKHYKFHIGSEDPTGKVKMGNKMGSRINPSFEAWQYDKTATVTFNLDSLAKDNDMTKSDIIDYFIQYSPITSILIDPKETIALSQDDANTILCGIVKYYPDNLKNLISKIEKKAAETKLAYDEYKKAINNFSACMETANKILLSNDQDKWSETIENGCNEEFDNFEKFSKQIDIKQNNDSILKDLLRLSYLLKVNNILTASDSTLMNTPPQRNEMEVFKHILDEDLWLTYDDFGTNLVDIIENKYMTENRELASKVCKYVTSGQNKTWKNIELVFADLLWLYSQQDNTDIKLAIKRCETYLKGKTEFPYAYIKYMARIGKSQVDKNQKKDALAVWKEMEDHESEYVQPFKTALIEKGWIKDR